jgi:hypothetical protein
MRAAALAFTAAIGGAGGRSVALAARALLLGITLPAVQPCPAVA